MDTKEIIGGVTAFVGLLSAWLAYRVKKREAKIRSERKASVLTIDDPAVQATYRDVRRLRRQLTGLYLAYALVVALIAIVFFRDIVMVLIVLVPTAICVCLMLVMFRFLRTEPPSRTMKTARVIMACELKDAMDSALSAVDAIGASVGKLDSEKGIIEARLRGSLIRGAALIRVHISEKNSGQSEIEVSSDATLPTVLFDFGANARNVRRLTSLVVGSSEDI
jgi:hypothetical protein